MEAAGIAAAFFCSYFLIITCLDEKCSDLQYQMHFVSWAALHKSSLIGLASNSKECASKCMEMESKCKSVFFDSNDEMCYESHIDFGDCDFSKSNYSSWAPNAPIYALFCITCTSTKLSSSSSMKAKSRSNTLNRLSKVDLRVMTLNTWRMGADVKHGLRKIAKHVKFVQPDVLGLQEVTNDSLLESLIDLLKPVYKKCSNSSSKSPILTRLQVLKSFDHTFWWCSGCKVRMSKRKNVNIWNVHLDHKNYHPYVACANKPPKTEKLLFKASRDLFRNEYDLNLPPSNSAVRLRQMIKLSKSINFRSNLRHRNLEPIIVMGDFNSPSHQDWTRQNKRANCGWAFRWPVTSYLTRLGFKDSFREIYPSPEMKPGVTWSPLHKKSVTKGLIEEPQSRIDFIFYSTSQSVQKPSFSLRPATSLVYHGYSPVQDKPFYKKNDWPSDHSAVITDFQIL